MLQWPKFQTFLTKHALYLLRTGKSETGNAPAGVFVAEKMQRAECATAAPVCTVDLPVGWLVGQKDRRSDRSLLQSFQVAEARAIEERAWKRRPEKERSAAAMKAVTGTVRGWEWERCNGHFAGRWPVPCLLQWLCRPRPTSSLNSVFELACPSPQTSAALPRHDKNLDR